MISNFFINRPIVAMVISIITLLGGFNRNAGIAAGAVS
jgi:multidrug efflux pump subunit AcrB